MIARAFWTVAAGQGEIRAEDLPPPAEGERRVTALASGISRGTEATVFAGRVPENQYAVMRAPLMGGDFPFPVKYGYAMVGDAEGERVFVLHPHQDVFNAPAAMCIPVPDAVPTRRAVLAANMETAVNILWDAAPLPGERIAVIGAGVVGLLVGYLISHLPGTIATVIDVDPGREALARALGCDFALPAATPAECELIIHASGNPAGLHAALSQAAFEGRIVEASWYGDTSVTLPLGEHFHARRLRLISSQVGAVSSAMRGRRSYADRLGFALSLLADSRLDALLGSVTRFDELPARMPTLLGGGLCHVVTYGEN